MVILNKAHWDNHNKCINCSHCSRESTCSTCSSWSKSVWILAESRRILAARKKAMTVRKKSQDPSISSEERKNKLGALPHKAVLAGERPILVATPWVLVPKGVCPQATGHWATLTGLPTTDPPTAGQLPNGEEDTSGRPGMPGHRPPGMPGHWAPATGQSPSTGQMGKKETSSLPITGHRPSSHRSLELDRLNSREIQESPSTGHARSPSNRPPGTGHQNIIQNIASDSHTFGVEFTSKQQSTPRVLLPLELDFSKMSDPSVVIEPLGNNWRLDNNGQYQTSLSGRRSRRDQSRERNRHNKRRRRRSSSSSSFSSYSSPDSPRESLGDRNIPIKREGDIHVLLPLRQYPIVEFVTMADTREIDTVLRLSHSLRRYLISRL